MMNKLLTEEEAFAILEAQGRNPMPCDTPVPFYDVSVPCGYPCPIGDEVKNFGMLPGEILKAMDAFVVRAKGDSMTGAGIFDGDYVLVDKTAKFYDSDIVVAVVDGESVIKCYCTDDNGQAWLTPQNEEFRAIQLKEEQNLYVLGVVIYIFRTRPRVSHRKCMEAVNRTKRERFKPMVATPQQVELAIRNADTKVKFGSLWFAVWRALVGKDEENGITLDDFCTKVATLLPDHQHLPTLRNLQRVDVLSFTKPVEEWREDNAPVTGYRFKAYKSLGLLTLELLNNTREKQQETR